MPGGFEGIVFGDPYALGADGAPGGLGYIEASKGAARLGA